MKKPFRFRSTARSLFPTRSGHSQSGRRLRSLEQLEARQLLAGDLDFLGPIPADSPAVELRAEGEDAEGEDAPDLVAFAKALTDAGVKFFGAAWCPHCTSQKELFQDGGQFLPFIEVTNPDRSPNQIGFDENVFSYPTWEFQDNSRVEGAQSLESLSQLSGIPIPTGSVPSLAPLEDTTLLSGSPLYVGLDGYDPNGGPLTYSITNSNPSLVEATLLTGNRSAKIDVAGFGEMTFELFESEAPRATGRFIELAQAGFYDVANNDPAMTIHRVIDDFVLQFGDPTGTGSGGSTLGDFDDDFHVDLQHNDAGILSWAKAGDDTNDSQIFITDAATRSLDFNHSVFGKIVEGQANRDAITRTATDSNDRPVVTTTIQSVSIFEDLENGMLKLKAAEGASGTAEITVTVTDVDGNQFSESFSLTVTPDTVDGGPFLEPLGTQQSEVNTSLQFQLAAVDVEGDPVFFEAAQTGNTNYTFDLNSQTGAITVTPPADFIGSMEILVGVRAANGSDTQDTFDTQVIPLVVTPVTPTAIDLLADSDSGSDPNDELTNESSLSFEVSGVTAGATVRLRQGDTILGQATATGPTVQINTTTLSALGDGTYGVFATQLLDGVESPASPSLDVTIDGTSPDAASSLPSGTIDAATDFSQDVTHSEEGSGLSYSLSNASSGMSIDPSTGVFTWTPDVSQVGTHEFGIVATDAAGNSTVAATSLQVTSATDVVIRLEVVDENDIPVTEASVGDNLFLRALVEDVRNFSQGVFSAYFDVEYAESLVSIGTPITYGSEFSNGTSGDSATAGLLDELGGFGGLSAIGSGEFLVWSVPFSPALSGTVTFQSNPADDIGHEVLVFGNNDPVALTRIEFGSVALDIDVTFRANADTFNFDEDSADNVLDVLANDNFLDGASGNLLITEVGTPSQGGVVQISADQKTLLYTPASDFFGSDTFTYTISDGTGIQTASVEVQVHPQNDDPTAVADSSTVTEDSTDNFLDLLSNDSSAPDGPETLRISDVSNSAQGGVVTLGSSGTHVLYSPPANFVGTDTFTYTLSDGNGGTAQETVTITVTELNDPPTAGNDTLTVEEDNGEQVIQVLLNDTTGGETTDVLSIIGVTQPTGGGSVRISADQTSLIYTPADNQVGLDTFIYTITDGTGQEAQAQVNVNLLPINDPPTLQADSFSVVKNSSDTQLSPLDNDSILPDTNEALSISAVGTTSAGGTVSITDGGQSLSYTPPADFVGTDTFTYTVQDSNGGEAQSTISVTVLDFIPSSLSGSVYMDVNNDGVHGSQEMMIAGVTILLTGTDQQGNAINLSQTTQFDGSYSFTDLAPGSYVITQVQPVFLLDGIESVGSQGGELTANDTISITLAEDTQGTDNNFGERGRMPQYIGLADTLVSAIAATRESVVLAAVDDVSQQSWLAVQGDWRTYEDIDVRWNQADVDFAFAITESDAQPKSTLVPVADQRVRQLGRSDNQALVQFQGRSVDFEFVAPAQSATSTSQDAVSGEGESVFLTLPVAEGESRPAPTALPSVSASQFNGLLAWDDSMHEQAEGESAAITRVLPPSGLAEVYEASDTLWLSDSDAHALDWVSPDNETDTLDEYFESLGI